MADEHQAKPSFKHTVVKKALAPLVATAATAATTYLMRKAAEVWHDSVQPKVEEKGGAEALAKQAADAVSSKLAPVSDAVTSKAGAATSKAGAATSKLGGGDSEPARAQASNADRSEERRKREERREQRRKAFAQTGSS